MIYNKQIYIHVGLHKTASTYLQQSLFPKYKEVFGFHSLRKIDELAAFNQYLLRENDLTYTPEKALQILLERISLETLENKPFTLSEEQFAGAPWNNAKDRKRNFDRLHQLFPNANYILVLRNQEALVQSLYHEYVKKGGTAHWKKFLSSKTYELEFGRGAYLNYATYYKYLVKHTDTSRVLVLYFEEFLNNNVTFLRKLTDYMGIYSIDVSAVPSGLKNTSIKGTNLRALRFVNRWSSTPRQPDLLVPQGISKLTRRFLRNLPNKGGFIIPANEVKKFCKPFKLNNTQLPGVEKVSDYGYLE